MNLLKKKTFKISLIFLIILMLILNTITASAHDCYFVAIGFDEASNHYLPTISLDKHSFVGGNHAEAEITPHFYLLYKGENYTIPSVPYSTASDEENLEEYYVNYTKDAVGNFDNNNPLLFSFPSFHSQLEIKPYNADGADEQSASRFANTVVTQLNEFIDFLIAKAQAADPNYQPNSAEIRAFLVRVLNKMPKSKNGTVSATTITDTFNGLNVTIKTGTRGSDIDVDSSNGFYKGDYLTVTCGEETKTFIFQCHKGYRYANYTDTGKYTKKDAKPSSSSKVDPLAKDVTVGNYYKKLVKPHGDFPGDVYKIGWQAIVLQGNFNLDVNHTGFSNLEEVTTQNFLTKGITTVAQWGISTISSFFGLYSLGELFTNSGTRGINYSYGLFNRSWTNSIYLFHIICQIIVWAAMAFSVLRILMRRQLATINIGEKVSMMNELKNLILCAFLLGSFPLIFNLMARLNCELVELFASANSTNIELGKDITVSSNLGVIILAFVFLAFRVYYNVFYMIRSIILAILYAIAPLCIFTLSLGAKYNKIYTSFMKELVSNIFVQTLHAFMISFFGVTLGTSTIRPLEECVIVYSFIPLTKFVKQNVFGMSEGIAGSVGSAITGMASGAAGAVGSGISAAKGGGGGGGGASGSYSGKSSGSSDKTSDSIRESAGKIDIRKPSSNGKNSPSFKDGDNGQGPTTNGINSTKASETLATTDKTPPNILGAAGGAAKGIGKHALNIGGAVLSAGAAIGTSAVTGNTASAAKAIANVGGTIGGAVGAAHDTMSTIHNNSLGSKEFKEAMRAHGVKHIGNTGEEIVKTFDPSVLNYKNGTLSELGEDGKLYPVNENSSFEAQSLQRSIQAQDANYDGMDAAEKAHQLTQDAKSGSRFTYDEKTGQVQQHIDKHFLSNMKSGSDILTHGVATQKYVPRPKPTREYNDSVSSEPSGGSNENLNPANPQPANPQPNNPKPNNNSGGNNKNDNYNKYKTGEHHRKEGKK